MEHSGPLKGTRIIDLATGVPGAYTAMLLGDMGADVVRVEFAGRTADSERPDFRLWNRGKRSVTVDAASEAGLEVVRRLAAHSDVLVTPSQGLPAALTYDALKAVNERLVYCLITPYGDGGPLDAAPADDGTVSAFAGMYGDQGGWQEPPVYVLLPITSYATAFVASLGISAALHAREKTGRGQRVEVPMMAACLAMQTGSIVSGPRVRTWARDARGQQGINPVYRLYKASDRWLFIACGNVVFWNKLCLAFDRIDWLEDPRFEGAPWNIPVEHRDALTAMMADIVKTRTRAEWLTYLSENDIPCAPVLSREEFVKHPQVVHNAILAETADPVLGPMRAMTVPVKFYGTPGAPGGPAHAPGQDTASVLAELGLGGKERR
ncbi:MAG: CoA transferase [SAR202 cluster bacterium]|nr:CoA transferase [SAR202 cluster bacterium]